MENNNKIKLNIGKVKTLFKSNITKFCIIILMLISISFVLIFTGEFIIRQDPGLVLNWMRDNTNALLLNMLVIAIGICMLVAITNNICIATSIVGGIYQIVCIINYYRYSISGQYLILNDFKLALEGIKIVQDFTLKFKVHILWSLLVLLWITITLFVFKWKSSKLRRSVQIIGITICTIIMISNFDKIEVNLHRLGIQDNQMFSEINYKTNGFLLTLVMDIPNVMVQKPKDYNKDNIMRIVDKYKTSSIAKGSVHPNVIMIMDEAMFDITKVEGMKLSKDPLENFHRYQQQYTKGKLIVPVYWGGTAQTEYEVLTGNSIGFLSLGNIAYMNYVSDNTISMVDFFKKENYTTFAIHPYDKTFYNRDKVYKQLGFDYFLSQDDFKNTQLLGRYISDLDTFKKVTEEYEKNKDKGPIFTHIVTMQNHAPYGTSKDALYQNVDVLNEELSQETKQEVSGYVNGLKHTDDAIEYLIKYFENVDEPTVIVVYGDHAPLLGNFYEEIGFMKDKSEEYKLYNTPLLIWNNYGLDSNDYGNIDSTQLGARLLNSIKIPGDYYFDMINTISNDLRAYNYKFIIDKDNNVIKENDIKEKEQELLNDLQNIQYDRMFGKKYSNKE